MDVHLPYEHSQPLPLRLVRIIQWQTSQLFSAEAAVFRPRLMSTFVRSAFYEQFATFVGKRLPNASP